MTSPNQDIFVSVVMPVYNSAKYLEEAIQSILEQTHHHFEFIIVDDCSSDGSYDIATSFSQRDSRIRLFRNSSNLGIVETRNIGFRESSASSKYLAIMDSDDVSFPTRFERQIAFLESHPDHALVGGNTLIIDEQSKQVGYRYYPSDDAEIKRVITRYNPFAQPTAMMRRSVLEEVGHYDHRYPRCQDYDLWCRIASRWKTANLNEFTIKYRISLTQGKRVHLHDSLVFTLKIQREWLFHKSFFNPYNVLYYGLEHCLLYLPESLVLTLFKKKTYRPI